MRALPLVLCALLASACGSRAGAPSTAAPVTVASATVLRSDTGEVALTDLVKKAPYTVLLFFSADCPVQKAHDARLRELVATYRPRGVAFAAIASEEGPDLGRLREELAKRALEMPLFEDRGAVLADALGVEYTTHVVLLDGERHVLYSGGIDSERTHTTDHAEPHLRNALEAVLAGKAVTKPRVEPLGCPLLKH